LVTTNVSDFWRKVSAHRRNRIVCLPLPNERQDEIPELRVRLFKQRDSRTVRQRMGKVPRVSWSAILYCQVGERAVTRLMW
jgi:hypothetical protein